LSLSLLSEKKKMVNAARSTLKNQRAVSSSLTRRCSKASIAQLVERLDKKTLCDFVTIAKKANASKQSASQFETWG
jgi:23S rRNA-/tRNA-specific pseudouridylate synthase